MSIVNKYAGATQYTSGATYLDSKAIINIQEGYKIGVTTEYVDIGNFEIEDYVHGGALDEHVQMSMHSPIGRLQFIDASLDVKVDSGVFYYRDFLDAGTLQRDFTVNAGTWGITDGYLRNTIEQPENYISIFLNPAQGINNFVAYAKMRSDDFSDSANLGFAFRATVDENGEMLDGYTADVRSPNFFRWDDGTPTNIASSGSFAPSNNIWYHIILAVRGASMWLAVHTDESFTSAIATVSTSDSTYRDGDFGIVSDASSSGVANSDVAFIDFREIADQQTAESTLRSIAGLGNIFDVSVADEVSNVDTWSQTSGSSWVVGNTNGLQQVDLQNTSSGASWHLLYSGATFHDFVLEYQMRGSTANFAGAFVGASTNKFFGNYHNLGISQENSVLYFNAGNTYRHLYGEHFNFQPDRWYNCKMVKSGYRIAWYVENILVNATYGFSMYTPYSTSGPDNNMIGLFAKQSGVSGTVTSFRNVRISCLDDLIDDMLIQSGDNIESAFGRYLPDGYGANWRSDQLGIFEIGSSRGIHGVTQYIENSDRIRSNISGHKYTRADSQDAFAIVSSTDARTNGQMDSMRYSFINNQNIRNAGDATDIATSQMQSIDRNTETVNVQIAPRVDLERYDGVDFVDLYTGVSQRMRVANMNKVFDAQTGAWYQNLVMQKDA